MSSVVHRPLVAGEESLFDSLPDLLPLRQISYAEGLAGGGFHPSRTWVALRDGRVVGRAAWVLPPGAVGGPWLERFDLIDTPRVGASLLSAAHEALGGPRPYYAALPAGWHTSPSVVSAVAPALAAAESAGLVPQGERLRLRWTPGAPDDRPAAEPSVRPASGPAEIDQIVHRIVTPDVLTGSETARAVAALDLARQPRPWLTGEATAWHVAHDGDEPLGLLGTAGQACWPMLGYLGVLPGPRSTAARSALIGAALAVLVAGGAEEVVADADADRSDVLADLKRAGFRPVRARLIFEPAGA